MENRLGNAVLFLALVIGIASFVQCWTPKNLLFVVPKGWPKPVYNFSENKVSKIGFSLGKKLFYDPVLSRDSTISCSSCHLQFTGFTHVDHPVSHGIEGRTGIRNSSSLINLAWNTSFHWDGGVNNLEVQAINPISHPAEMDFSLEKVLVKLNSSKKYRGYFFQAFNDSSINSQRLLKALAQFTVCLESFNSKYDKYMRRERGGEFTDQEINGLQLFRKHCSSCHSEPLFTNFQFENNGLTLNPEFRDLGRFNITGNPVDSMRFKVPTLRNIEFTYPYMHDGRFKKLKDVINHYSNEQNYKSTTTSIKLQLPIYLSPEDKKDLLAFLLTLTDKDFLYDPRFRYERGE